MKSSTKHKRPFNLILGDTEEFFIPLRKWLKYCSNCGNKLDLPWSDFHIPLCQKCREIMIKDISKGWKTYEK